MRRQCGSTVRTGGGSTRENGTTIEPNDPFWDDLVAAATAARDDPRAWLEMHNNYGDHAGQPAFAEAFATWLTMIWTEGMEAAIDAYCASGTAPQKSPLAWPWSISIIAPLGSRRLDVFYGGSNSVREFSLGDFARG